MKIWILILVTSLFVAWMMPFAGAQIQTPVSSMTQNGIWHVSLNKQIQIAADVSNNQNRQQPFAYIVQIKNTDGVVIQLSWLTGTLDTGQSLNPSQSWTPTDKGNYTAQIFVWRSIDNPDALSIPLSMHILVT